VSRQCADQRSATGRLIAPHQVEDAGSIGSRQALTSGQAPGRDSSKPAAPQAIRSPALPARQPAPTRAVGSPSPGRDRPRGGLCVLEAATGSHAATLLHAIVPTPAWNQVGRRAHSSEFSWRRFLPNRASGGRAGAARPALLVEASGRSALAWSTIARNVGRRWAGPRTTANPSNARRTWPAGARPIERRPCARAATAAAARTVEDYEKAAQWPSPASEESAGGDGPAWRLLYAPATVGQSSLNVGIDCDRLLGRLKAGRSGVQAAAEAPSAGSRVRRILRPL